LAYKHVVYGSKYKVRAQSYKTQDLVELLGLSGNGEQHSEYIVANHINKLITYFCNSDKAKIQDLNYLDVVNDTKARAFVRSGYQYIVAQARLLLSKMDKGEIDIIHDFYLKKFQLANPRLNYDYILFDEGQDASAAMLDVFLKQSATKVIVGDTHQQIYGWRYAVNSLEQTDFNTLHLSTSFRFTQDIANLAMEVLKWKTHLGKHEEQIIIGAGKRKAVKSKAILARTNLGLLLKAIEHVTERGAANKLYFEGNFNSYTYADEGASLYDVLNLYNHKRHLIKDKLIKAMRDMPELEDYIEKTEDVQLGMMVEIVNKYGNDIPRLIKIIKSRHVDNEERDKAEVIFSTVHRCKGMEYDEVHLAGDFLSEEKLKKAIEENRKAGLSNTKLSEEVNLLYVAITRTKNNLHIPEHLVPAEFPESNHIHVLGKPDMDELMFRPPTGKEIGMMKRAKFKADPEYKAQMIEKAREKDKSAYQSWSEEMDIELTMLYCEKKTLKELSAHFRRSQGAIKSRIKKLELPELYG